MYGRYPMPRVFIFEEFFSMYVLIDCFFFAKISFKDLLFIISICESILFIHLPQFDKFIDKG